MQYQPNELKAEHIHGDADWSILKVMGSWTLCYARLDGRSGKPSTKGLGIAFGNTEIMRKVAYQLLLVAAAQDELDKAGSKEKAK